MIMCLSNLHKICESFQVFYFRDQIIIEIKLSESCKRLQILDLFHSISSQT